MSLPESQDNDQESPEVTEDSDVASGSSPQDLESFTLESHSSSTTFERLGQQFRQQLTWLEVSGSCGDFGTLFPLLVALARDRRIYLAPTLLLTGVAHLITAWYWNIPMPLQPMHMISALAISQTLTRDQVATAGVGMGLCFTLLQFRNLIGVIQRWIPKGVIGGIQLGVGWKVAVKGIHMVQLLPWWGSLDSILMAILASVLVLLGLRSSNRTASSTTQTPTSVCQSWWEQPPVGLYLSAMGLILAAWHLFQGPHQDLKLQPEPFIVNALKNVTWQDWTTGWLQGSLPQLPLTTLNSCLSVCLLAHTLFPQPGNAKVTHKSVCRSIALINALLCPLGCAPHCHGAGGLAGQYRLGATTGTSMVVLGLFKIALSVLAHQGSLLLLLDALPVSILGVLLALSGHELAMTGIKAIVTGSPTVVHHNLAMALVTAVVIVGTGQTHVGALCGWLTYIIHGNGIQELCGRRDDSDEDEMVDAGQANPVTASDTHSNGNQRRGCYRPLDVAQTTCR